MVPLPSLSVSLAVLVISTDGVTTREIIVGSSCGAVSGSSLVDVAWSDTPAGVTKVPVAVTEFTRIW